MKLKDLKWPWQWEEQMLKWLKDPEKPPLKEYQVPEKHLEELTRLSDEFQRAPNGGDRNAKLHIWQFIYRLFPQMEMKKHYIFWGGVFDVRVRDGGPEDWK